jgi:hypothetical protein
LYRDLSWDGSFEEYLQLIRERPKVTRNAFQRVYDMVLSYGTDEYIDNKKKLIRYNFFQDPIDNGKDAIFGLDIPLMRLMSVLKAAAEGYGPERRVILLHGPVGSSKSTIARALPSFTPQPNPGRFDGHAARIEHDAADRDRTREHEHDFRRRIAPHTGDLLERVPVVGVRAKAVPHCTPNRQLEHTPLVAEHPLRRRYMAEPRSLSIDVRRDVRAGDGQPVRADHPAVQNVLGLEFEPRLVRPIARQRHFGRPSDAGFVGDRDDARAFEQELDPPFGIRVQFDERPVLHSTTLGPQPDDRIGHRPLVLVDDEETREPLGRRGNDRGRFALQVRTRLLGSRFEGLFTRVAVRDDRPCRRHCRSVVPIHGG